MGKDILKRLWKNYHLVSRKKKDGQATETREPLQDVIKNKELQKEIKCKQNEVNKLQRRLEILIEKSSDIFEIIKPDGTIQYISEAVLKFTGYNADERIGKKVYEFFTEKDLQKLKEMITFVLNNSDERVRRDISFETKSGKHIHLEVTMQNLLNEPSIEGILVNYRDITSRLEMEKRMVHIFTHDELTGLPNQRSFNMELTSQYEYAQMENEKFGLLMLDIDGLKYVNYALGYKYGNKLIIEIVQRLKDALDKNGFISRYSDDHFAIITPELKTYEECTDIAKHIIDLLSRTYKIENYELGISVNIGICICTDNVKDIETLKHQAKIALLRAKRKGKNTYEFYSSDLDIQSYKEATLRSDLHYAIERKELKVYYQPIVNLRTNDILGAEALIRWEHPEWGMVSPDEFISMAEEIGLIIDIGKWVLKKVCENYRGWIDNGLPAIKVSVNFSSIQFLEDDFVESIRAIIDDYKLDPKFLIMEITESVLLKNMDKVIQDIKKLQSLGIQIALDDFGTGFSSLAYLCSLNIDILKIDESFIRNVPNDYTSTVITKSIVNLTKELKIKLVAEGIENWEQLLYLRESNCYAGQGYIYSKPLELKDFQNNLAKKRCKPRLVNPTTKIPRVDRRKFFRIEFYQLLEADMTILEVKGKKINIGNTKVLIKNIGPGGLCFISTIKFPAERGLILQFTTELLGEKIKVYGCTVWVGEIEANLYKYGIEFTFDENHRTNLIKYLNQVQVKMRNNILFSDGSFVPHSAPLYFRSNGEL